MNIKWCCTFLLWTGHGFLHMSLGVFLILRIERWDKSRKYTLVKIKKCWLCLKMEAALTECWCDSLNTCASRHKDKCSISNIFSLFFVFDGSGSLWNLRQGDLDLYEGKQILCNSIYYFKVFLNGEPTGWQPWLSVQSSCRKGCSLTRPFSSFGRISLATSSVWTPRTEKMKATLARIQWH